jgi:hypothetical protein
LANRRSRDLSLSLEQIVSFRYAPQIEVLFKVDGTQASPVKDIRVSSLTLRHAAPTYMANYSVGSGGDYSVHRGGAVLLTGA